MAVLRTPVDVRGENMTTVAEFDVKAGDLVPFVFTYQASHLPVPKPIDPDQALIDTETFWTDWSRRNSYDGKHRALVQRSLITLKALTYAPTGGIVAAPTSSLPEKVGGARNWDYRCCWLRDATFTLFSLMNSGYHEEAGAWHNWLLRSVAGSPSDLQIMYSITGQRRLLEWEADWLPGYEGSKPVRFGNAAHAPAAARCLWRTDGRLFIRPAKRTSSWTEAPGRWNARSWTMWRRSGSFPTAASGRCAVPVSTMCFPR